MSKNTATDSAIVAALLTREEAITKTRVSQTMFAQLAKRPDFPKPIKIGRRTFYVEHELDEFIASLRQSAA